MPELVRANPAPTLPAIPRRAFLAWSGLIALCLLFGLVAITRLELDPLSRHMAMHILLMSGVGPLLALVLDHTGLKSRAPPGELGCATIMQLAVLWGWHAPGALAFAHSSSAAHFSMQASLLAASLWFWIAVLGQTRAGRWRAIVALLLTGKIVCLLGVILTFAPRPLYPALTGAHEPAHGAASALADQQLAGLMMLASCPVTYVLAGVLIAARWLDELSAEER